MSVEAPAPPQGFDEKFVAQMGHINELAPKQGVEYDAEGDIEGGSSEVIQDVGGNALRATLSYAGDSIQATYQQNGGAEQGGRTYETREQEDESKVTVTRASGKTATYDSPRLAAAVNARAHEAIDKNAQ